MCRLVVQSIVPGTNVGAADGRHQTVDGNPTGEGTFGSVGYEVLRGSLHKIHDAMFRGGLEQLSALRAASEHLLDGRGHSLEDVWCFLLLFWLGCCSPAKLRVIQKPGIPLALPDPLEGCEEMIGRVLKAELVVGAPYGGDGSVPLRLGIPSLVVEVAVCLHAQQHGPQTIDGIAEDVDQDGPVIRNRQGGEVEVRYQHDGGHHPEEHAEQDVLRGPEAEPIPAKAVAGLPSYEDAVKVEYGSGLVADAHLVGRVGAVLLHRRHLIAVTRRGFVVGVLCFVLFFLVSCDGVGLAKPDETRGGWSSTARVSHSPSLGYGVTAHVPHLNITLAVALLKTCHCRFGLVCVDWLPLPSNSALSCGKTGQ